mmetsp:Transcript_7849/g.25890  ORF Transcript_7849/g.25890 Transcript_7849/m.25890 type:complete len:337 (+) Transcript_7849:388-1398(+)
MRRPSLAAATASAAAVVTAAASAAAASIPTTTGTAAAAAAAATTTASRTLPADNPDADDGDERWRRLANRLASRRSEPLFMHLGRGSPMASCVALARGHPMHLSLLHKDPRIVLVRNFLSPAEAAAVVALARRSGRTWLRSSVGGEYRHEDTVEDETEAADGADAEEEEAPPAAVEEESEAGWGEEGAKEAVLAAEVAGGHTAAAAGEAGGELDGGGAGHGPAAPPGVPPLPPPSPPASPPGEDAPEEEEAPRACRREKMAVLRWVWVLVWSVPGCKGHTYRLPTVCTVNTELAGLVVRLSKFTISPPRVSHVMDTVCGYSSSITVRQTSLRLRHR